MAIPSMTKKELNQIAIDLAGQKIFCDRFLRDQNMTSRVFLPIIFAAADWKEDDIKDIGLIYEYYDKAGPRSINGYPIFLSMRLLNTADAAYVWAKAQKVEEAQKKLQDEILAT